MNQSINHLVLEWPKY